jgi:hypothetical protein
MNVLGWRVFRWGLFLFVPMRQGTGVVITPNVATGTSVTFWLPEHRAFIGPQVSFSSQRFFHSLITELQPRGVFAYTT